MSTVSLSRGPFPGFVELAPTIWYYNPNSQARTQNGFATTTKNPDLIVLSTWMGAASKHIQKYIIGYQTLYPTSPLLIMTNSISDIILRTHNYHKENLKPAIRVIREVAETHEHPKILLHLFSNGGAHHVAHLAFLYRRQFNTPLPISGMILDSAPGRATYGRSVAAMSVSLPQFFLLRILGLLVIYAICSGMWVKHHIFRRENIISRVRKQLLDPELFPTAAPRVYIYSKADAMVGWEDVENNARLAEERGYKVEKERFEKSKHVGHLMVDGERYWGAVKKVAR